MRLDIAIALFVAVVGAFVYALSANAKASELGRLAFAVGLLAFLLSVGHERLTLP